MYQNQRKFSGNLHALRGLAALSVIFYHAKAMNGGIDVGWMSIVGQFGAGVTLFFILSGFSLSLSNFPHIDKPNWLRGYSIKRIARIIPVWYCFIAITWVFHYFKYDGHMHPLNHVLYNLIPFYPLVPGREPSLVWAGWTIGVELMFYMVFPIMLVLFRNSLRAWGLALIGLLSISLALRSYAGPEADSFFVNNSFSRQAFVFVLGCAFYFLVQRAIEKKREKPLALVMCLVSALGFFLWFAYVRQIISFPPEFVLPIQALSLASLTVVAYLNPVIGKRSWLNLYNPVTKFLGDKSFTIYLAHPIIVSILKPFYGAVNEAVPNSALSYIIYVSAVIALSSGVAAIISTYIEEPLYKRGRDYAGKAMTAPVELQVK